MESATFTRAASGQASGLTKGDIVRIVNRYIGVEGGYLGDFSYRTHGDFYPEFCNLDINPFEYLETGTTRERFIRVLELSPPHDQAKIIRGVLDKYPVGSHALRTAEARDELVVMAEKLERDPIVEQPALALTSDVVVLALKDAETLLQSGGPTSAVDRVHTALHGHLRYLCDEAGIPYDSSETMVSLLKKLRRTHRKLEDLGPRRNDIETVLNACASILDALNPMRNSASVAHPNPSLLPRSEAQLVINVGRSLLTYLDSKLGEELQEPELDQQS